MRSHSSILGILLIVWPITSPAEQSQTFGDYTVHYNAFTTDILEPSVARAYKILRSKNRVLVNVSVLKKVMGTTGQPVRAKIQARATNLSAQVKILEIREIRDKGAFYYIAETPVSDEETLKFTLHVIPDHEDEGHTITFQEQFFTD
ncbi:MAG: DUF4426 domain-containing protein [Gammaproteobacteria bacterium]|nr:DUF4426 domain-containing protein [Gammaproteobacteria bacterium]